MSATLYGYYERELRFLRQSAEQFSRQYPATAGRLLLEGRQSADPHVERLIQSFALLTARIQHKLDDEFPELTDAILGTVYPHYLAPIPSMGTAQFELDAKRAQSPTGFTIERYSQLESQPHENATCRFRTCYPVTLWPVGVAAAEIVAPPFPRGYRPPPGTEVALRIALECTGPKAFAEMALDRLRFYLNGDSPMVAELYELLFNHVLQVALQPADDAAKREPVLLEPARSIGEVGFGRDEGMLPYPRQSFLGYRLLTEFFAFPQKFRFFDLRGLERTRDAVFGRRLDIVLFLGRRVERIEHAVGPSTLLLGCTPIVNLFSQVAEPIALTQAQFQYPVVPSAAHAQSMEVYSVDSVTSIDSVGSTTEYEPFYSLRHARDADSPRAFWYTSRKPSIDGRSAATEVQLSLVDLDFNPRLPADSVLSVRTTCTNGDLPRRLQMTSQRVEFRLAGSAPVSRMTTVGPLTRPIAPTLGRRAHWRLLSHLNLNYLSLTGGQSGCEALRELLRLYDFSDSGDDRSRNSVNARLIEGITAIATRPIVAQTGCDVSSGFSRGARITLDFDAEKYVGTGVYLFAAVLERFFALHASINSFTQLVARVADETVLKEWPPRAGEQPLS